MSSHFENSQISLKLQLGSKGCWIPRSCKDHFGWAAKTIDSSEDQPAGCDRQRFGHIPKNHMCSVCWRCSWNLCTWCSKSFFGTSIVFLQPSVQVTNIPALVTAADDVIAKFKALKDAGQLGWKTSFWENTCWLGPKGLWIKIKFCLKLKMDEKGLVSSSKQILDTCGVPQGYPGRKK